jgi:valyl-tRNA synthetase
MENNSDSTLSATYSPAEVEQKWYPRWEEGQYFVPRAGKAQQPYCIIMPPPNVTGILHAGHALDVTTQDALIRFKRMKGYEALWLPGMDHAGISTQSVVEKMLFDQEGKTRHSISREEFLEKIWHWKEEYGGKIAHQQRMLGASPDWNYSMFTMDDEANYAVKKFFVDLYNEGLIYQSNYIVNWDPELQSAISDAEVEHKEVQGHFYHLHYKIKDSDAVVEIATTRPETLLGDTALCVHPEDDRFKHLVGKTAIVPLCDREIPIIADSYVDMEKGTGCLKVTPGHDFNDFEIGKRHGLPTLNILNKDGTLNDLGLEWKGLKTKVARKKIAEKLTELGILIETKKHTHQVGHGEKSKVAIEPMVSMQWFLNVQEMAKEAVSAVENDTTRFYPKGWENTYFSWLREPKDWCISRQLVWGHRIPVFTCNSCGSVHASIEVPTQCPKCQHNQLTQDPDVLDTWFSSGLWPMTTLGWPNPELMQKRGFDKFFPTSVLVTGFDIIFFWVARMMMMSLKAVKEVPFHKVYIHAIVLDKNGVKMSKSLGNGIDPLETIKEYGADAFRFTLAAGSGYNRNLNLDPERIAGYRNFMNKIWNAFRFIQPSLSFAQDDLDLNKLGHQEKWILSELNQVAKEMNSSMEEFRYDDSCSAIYSFVYDRFCSWFIELSKNVLKGDDEAAKVQRASVLKFSFRKIVALLHPISPYITEELWEMLKSSNEDLLIIQEYPEFDDQFVFKKDQLEMSQFIEVVTQIRNLRASVNMKPKDEIQVHLFCDDSDIVDYFSKHQAGLMDLTRATNISLSPRMSEKPKKAVVSSISYLDIAIPLEGVIDLEDQVKRLEKELNKTQGELAGLEKKLTNPSFMERAPKELVDESLSKKQLLNDKIQALQTNLKNFKS